MTGAYFSPRAIRANEELVRQMFAVRPGDDARMVCKSHLGMEIGPAFTRAILAEVNRGTSPDVSHPALHAIFGWMLATSLASVTDKALRMEMLKAAIAEITMEAGAFLLENEQIEVPDEAHGEVVGGHG